MVKVSKKERAEILAHVRSLYDNVLDVKLEQKADDPSILLVTVVRGVELPAFEYKTTKEGDKK
jgi:hypothetical protein